MTYPCPICHFSPCQCYRQPCGGCYCSPCVCSALTGTGTPGFTFRWPPEPKNSLTDDDVRRVAAEVLRLLEERLGPLNELAKVLLGSVPK